MKITVLGTRGFPNVQGGIERHCEHLYARLAAKGCRVTVLGRKPYIGGNTIYYKGVRVIPLACPKSKFLETFFHTLYGVFVARKDKCDILHIHGIGPSLMVPLARLLGLRVVMTNHGPDYERKKWNRAAKAILRLGERIGCIFSNKVICISDPIAEGVRKKYEINPAVIPNGIDIPNMPECGTILKKYGLEKNKYILTVGRFVPEKGFDELIEAFDLSSLDDWKLVLAGAADHETDYSRSLKRKAERKKNIILTGFLKTEELEKLYGGAGIFILPSHHEGLSIVFLEAMSYGIPCLASDIPANRCFEFPEENYFPAGNIEKISRKLKEFTEKDFSPEKRKAQIEKLRRKYSWDNIARETLGVYKKVAEK